MYTLLFNYIQFRSKNQRNLQANNKQTTLINNVVKYK